MRGEVVFVDQPVHCRFEAGLVFAELQSGGEIIHIAMSIPTFVASFANAGLVAHQWRMEEGAKIVDLALVRDGA